MRKILITIGLFAFISCAKHSEEIDIVKSDLVKRNHSKDDIEQMQFQTFEVTGKDVYKYNSNRLQKDYKSVESLGNYELSARILKRIDSVLKNYKEIESKKFVKVIAYKTAPDTISKSIYFIDDAKNINSFHLVK